MKYLLLWQEDSLSGETLSEEVEIIGQGQTFDDNLATEVKRFAEDNEIEEYVDDGTTQRILVINLSALYHQDPSLGFVFEYRHYATQLVRV